MAPRATAVARLFASEPLDVLAAPHTTGDEDVLALV